MKYNFFCLAFVRGSRRMKFQHRGHVVEDLHNRIQSGSISRVIVQEISLAEISLMLLKIFDI